MSAPEKGTPEYALWVAAIEVAIHAPLKQGTYSSDAKVRWHAIHELRAALDAVGIDWRTAKVKNDAERREAETAVRARLRDEMRARQEAS